MEANAALHVHETRLSAAKFAYEYSQAHCQQHPNAQTCAWYHGSWQFLRLLDLVSTPASHFSHFDSQLKEIAADFTFKNILISGSADSALVQAVYQALAHRKTDIRLTAVDICATPLKVCEHYADTVGINIETLRQDVLEGLPSGSFDAIFTHSFMGYFNDADRQRLLSQWAQSLRKGGRLVTVQRIRENYPSDIVRFNSAEVDAFVARAADLMQQPGNEDLTEFDIVAMARTFAENFQNFPVRSARQLQDMFEASGFKLTKFRQQETKGINGVTGPSVPNAAGFFLIVAERL